MSLALHGHHVLLVATLAFATAVLTPEWYKSSDSNLIQNVFQICQKFAPHYQCSWILLPTADNQSFRTIFSVLIASFAIACGGTSLIGLLLGSWYLQRTTRDTGSKWLLTLTIFATLCSFLCSCGVWTIMLTTNLHDQNQTSNIVRAEDFGFSMWLGIASSGVFAYAFLIYTIAICNDF